jgi:hypothetical protein
MLSTFNTISVERKVLAGGDASLQYNRDSPPSSRSVVERLSTVVPNTAGVQSGQWSLW